MLLDKSQDWQKVDCSYLAIYIVQMVDGNIFESKQLVSKGADKRYTILEVKH